MVIPHAHYRHSTNFHALQDIINTSTPNTPQLAQTQAIKILWHSRALSLLLYHEWTDRWLLKCLPSICLLTSTKGTEISHPLDLMVMESSIVDKLLPIRAPVITQIFSIGLERGKVPGGWTSVDKILCKGRSQALVLWEAKTFTLKVQQQRERWCKTEVKSKLRNNFL